MKLKSNNRGQATAVFKFFVALVGGAILVLIINEVTSPLFEFINDNNGDPTAATGTTYLEQGINFLPIAFLMISVFGLVAYAVYSREVVGR